MATTFTSTIHDSRQYFYSTTMDSSADKEERKREYNRLAQREFRRRRKEHLKNLEQAQKEQSSEQSEEIERLRYQNDELRRENETLRAQLYGSTSQSLLLQPVGQIPSDHRQYSLSPSISGASISNAGYTRNARSAMGPSNFQHPSLSVPRASGSGNATDQQPRTSSSRQNVLMVMVPYDRKQGCIQIRELFRPLLSDPSIVNGSSPDRHLALLHSMTDMLPSTLKPNKSQLEKAHYYAIDMIASPSLRHRLMNLTGDIVQSFIRDFGSCIGEADDAGQIIIWGDDPYNETSWEVSQPLLERWGWLLGRDFVDRSNTWRAQRGDPLYLNGKEGVLGVEFRI
ncbi:hypothetical protein H4I95_10806 [Botrytis cinerea]